MNLLDYIGRFHPVLVHLPIGILIAAIFLEVLSNVKGFRKVRKSVKVLLVLGFAAAFVSSTTGLLHAQSGEFDESLIISHRALALTVTFFSLVAAALHGRKKQEMRLAYFIIMFALAILILLTGHSGGSITHGTDFLQPTEADEKPIGLVINSQDELYTGLVAPIFKQKCVNCHGPSRQKGKLRLDQPEFILKGGEDNILANGHAGEMWRRIHLDRNDEDHMPPKEKTPLTQAEISIITYWLDNGNPFTGTLASLPRADSLIKVLAIAPEEVKEKVVYPDDKIMSALREGGVTVSFLSKDDGRISLQFINADAAKLADLIIQLPSINRQVVEIKMPGIKITHEQWGFLQSMTALERIHLERSSFSDHEMAFLNTCVNLGYLNLVSTTVTAKGLARLSLNKLKQLYIYQTAVKEADLSAVQKLFPGTSIVFGNYQVATLESDTVEVKAKPTKK